ncbi:MAG: plasminogen-binding N-terminal domain-containing protein, partial [Sulfurimonas sp.]|nr:plasminogen-binding N-terminal domain-containing protein [Sulfurimonas sp.]
MKYIFLVLFLVFELFAGIVKSPIVSVDEQNSQATIEVDKIDVGLSGFIFHKVSDEEGVILKNIVVVSYDKDSKIATLEMSPFDALRNNALPDGKWSVSVGDEAILAFGYTRGLLIAPNEDIYHRVTRSVKDLQWIHPDLFATTLSFVGHPTPLRDDFRKFSIATSVGLVFIYLNEKLFTIDAKSFNILSITDAQLKQEETQLPFYMRVEKINAAWWGEGNSELEAYEPHYYELLKRANPDNKELADLIKNYKAKV